MPTSAQSQPATPQRRLDRPDLRDMLLKSGAGSYMAEMSIPYMNFLPGTTEPYAQGVIQIVKGLQRLLVRRGARLAIDGGMGKDTLAALKVYAGPRWYEKSWAQLYADVIEGKRWSGYIRIDRGMDGWEYGGGELGGVIDEIIAGPLPWIGAGALVWWLATKRRRA